MNYFSISSVDTTHLHEKGSNQVNDFVSFVQPLLPDIKRGDAAKAEIAQYYLDHKDQYSDGVIKVLEPWVEMLGVSGSYIRQLKLAREFQDSIYNKELKSFVAEHPISVQYHLRKVPIQDLSERQLTGEHYSKREAENVTRVTKGDNLSPVTQPEAEPMIDRNQQAKDLADEDNCLTLMSAMVVTNHSRYNILEAALHILQTTEAMSPQTRELVQKIGKVIDGEDVAIEAKPVVHHDISSYFDGDGKVNLRVR